MSRRTVLELALAAVVLAGFAVLVVRQEPASGIEVERRHPAAGIDEIRVHVTGAVRSPGVVTVPPGARLADAVALAGGLAADADPASVNLARRAVDEDQVYVARVGEDAPPLLDLNTATADELEALPGIGPVYAGRIVEARAEAPFAGTDDLVERSVIPEHVYEQIRDLVAVR